MPGWFAYNPDDRHALPVLIRHVGLLGTIVVGARVKLALGRGEPFETLPAPVDERERLSREQIGGAIVLWRELRERLPADVALAATEEVVVAAGVAFLDRTLGRLRRDELAALDEDGRRRFAEQKGERFFNATMIWNEVSAERVRFTVTSCHFPRLCVAVGARELAPMFCRVDAKFFGGVATDVELVRPSTIAEGARECSFTLQWKDP